MSTNVFSWGRWTDRKFQSHIYTQTDRQTDRQTDTHTHTHTHTHTQSTDRLYMLTCILILVCFCNTVVLCSAHKDGLWSITETDHSPFFDLSQHNVNTTECSFAKVQEINVGKIWEHRFTLVHSFKMGCHCPLVVDPHSFAFYLWLTTMIHQI